MDYSSQRPRPSRKKRQQNIARARQQTGPDPHTHDGIRLQKVLADAGLGSRRTCEQMILDGRVEVDGQIVIELGTRVNPASQRIVVDSLPVSVDTHKVYFALNKPAKVVSSIGDPEGRKNLEDYTRDRPERLFHIGRLDYETEGLLLLTNDGEMANRLTHPRYEIPKKYLAQVRGPVAKDVGARLRDGIELEDGITHVDSFKLIDTQPGLALVEVVLHSGKNRIVRRLLDAVGNPVLRLVRTEFGPIELAEQRQGKMRQLRPGEVSALMEAVDL